MNEWVIMFVDMVDSTSLKYNCNSENSENTVVKLIKELFSLIESETPGKSYIKFTGDGAMVTYKKSSDGCQMAIKAAERIIQGVDVQNLQFDMPRFHIRIGIATGKCEKVSEMELDLSGKSVDLAARLCAEADTSSILIDEATINNSNLPTNHFTPCERRLLLKGIPLPPDSVDKYYFLKPDRFLKSLKHDNFSKGLLSLYPDRHSLSLNLTPQRIVYLAAPHSEIFVAGRTLITWAKISAEMKHFAKYKGIRFRFLISSLETSYYLDKKQEEDIRKDLPKAKEHFSGLVDEDPQHFQFCETDQLIMDGITFAKVIFPGEKRNDKDGKLIALQDINAAAGNNKAALLFACTCNSSDEESNIACMAHGLYKRTQHLYTESLKTKNGENSITNEKNILRGHNEGLETRKNHPSNYVHRMIPYFKCIKKGNLNKVPSPICVQIQVSSKCTTKCVMCDHWRNNKEDLTLDRLKALFYNIARAGTETIILSGGEPLMREDIIEVFRLAHGNNLKIGLLTNGTMPQEESNIRKEVINSIKQYVSWVAISIDGTPIEDDQIRNPVTRERIKLIKEFCNGLKEGPDLSATVTLQKNNSPMNLTESFEFIRKLGIPQVNFKLATGAWETLTERPKYLMDESELTALNHFLYNDPLPVNKSNNLDYIRRCFANDYFVVSDTVEGTPLRSFHANHNIRCFAPFLFSLIDSDGKVYPCCHLYRDNHGYDSRSKGFREKHYLGNITEKEFSQIWNGLEYVEKRRQLRKIDPKPFEYSPCGECTRYFQHNIVLTEIYTEYKDKLQELEKELEDKKDSSVNPVWF